MEQRIGNHYHYTRDYKEEKEKEYKGEKYTVRKLNPKTEQYEYEEILVNHKLDWENEEEMLNNNIWNEKIELLKGEKE